MTNNNFPEVLREGDIFLCRWSGEDQGDTYRRLALVYITEPSPFAEMRYMVLDPYWWSHGVLKSFRDVPVCGQYSKRLHGDLVVLKQLPSREDLRESILLPRELGEEILKDLGDYWPVSPRKELNSYRKLSRLMLIRGEVDQREAEELDRLREETEDQPEASEKEQEDLRKLVTAGSIDAVADVMREEIDLGALAKKVEVARKQERIQEVSGGHEVKREIIPRDRVGVLHVATPKGVSFGMMFRSLKRVIRWMCKESGYSYQHVAGNLAADLACEKPEEKEDPFKEGMAMKPVVPPTGEVFCVYNYPEEREKDPPRFTSLEPPGSIVDRQTGLEWFVSADAAVSMDQAEGLLQGLNDRFVDSWRMPTVEEAKTLCQELAYDPKQKQVEILPSEFKTTGTSIWVQHLADGETGLHSLFNFVYQKRLTTKVYTPLGVRFFAVRGTMKE